MERRSGRKALAAARAAGCNDPAAAYCRHTGAKSMTALAHDLAGLISPLHGKTPVVSERIGLCETSPQRPQHAL